MKYLLFLLVLFNLAKGTKACSCDMRALFYWNWNNSKIVFKGKIIRIKDPSINEEYYKLSKERVITFKIASIYKGVISYDTIDLETGYGGGDCGLGVEVGDIWTIFSSGFDISICEMNYLNERNGEQRNAYYFDLYYNKIPLQRNLDSILYKSQYINELDSIWEVSAIGFMNKGFPEGLWNYKRHLIEDGDTIFKTEEVFYKNGVPDGAFCYYSNGKLEAEEWFINGKMNGNTNTFFRSGHLQSQRKDDGKGNSRYTKYYKDGSVLSEKITQNGKTTIDITYLDGEKTTDYLFYDKNEILTRFILNGGEEEEIEVINEKGETVKEKRRGSKTIKIEGK